jgi:hypothetical protein
MNNVYTTTTPFYNYPTPANNITYNGSNSYRTTGNYTPITSFGNPSAYGGNNSNNVISHSDIITKIVNIFNNRIDDAHLIRQVVIDCGFNEAAAITKLQSMINTNENMTNQALRMRAVVSRGANVVTPSYTDIYQGRAMPYIKHDNVYKGPSSIHRSYHSSNDYSDDYSY